MAEINNNTPINELTAGGTIYTAGNAKNFNEAICCVYIRKISWTIY